MLAGPTGAFAGDGTFPTASTVPIGGPTSISVAVGDFNNDADQDLAVVNLTGLTGVSIHLGSTDATFITPPLFIPEVMGPYDIAVADFNNDGNDDLAVANAGSDNVGILIGNGNGTFGAPAGVGAGDRPHSVAVGDINADGNEDLVVANSGDDRVTVNLGNGNGTFGAAVSTTVGDAPDDVAIAEIGGNAFPDVLVANEDDSNVQLLNNKNPNVGEFFAFNSDKVGTATGPSALATGDFNRDKYVDFAAAASTAGALTVVLGKFAAFGDPNSISNLGTFPQSVAVGDFNSDYVEDLATAANGLKIDLGAGTGSFAAPVPYGAANNARSVAIGDFDSDGNEDVVVAGDESIMIRLGGGQPLLAGNLLTNGGFEGASAVRSPLTDPPPAIPGWERTGTMTAARYGMRFSSIFPNRLDAPRFGGGGPNFLFGGPSGASSTAFQTVDVSGSSASIDAGLAEANLSAYLGGGSVYADNMKATAAFLDAGGSALGSFDIGPVTATDRAGRTTMLPKAASAPVPAGSRLVRVTLTATNTDASGNSAFADNVKLTLDAPAPVDPPEDPPADPDPDTTAPDTIKGKGPKRRSRRRAATFDFSSEPGATFECQLDKRAAVPCSAPYKVRKLKPRRHVFQVVAIDAAGNRDSSPAQWRFRVLRPER